MTFITPQCIWKLFLATLLLFCETAQLQAGSATDRPLKPDRPLLLLFKLAINDATNVNQEAGGVSKRSSASSQQPQDLSQAKADGAFEAGERLRKEGSAKSSKKAIEKYNEALVLYQAAGNRSGEAKTLNNIGISYDYLGEKRRALQYFNEALPIQTALEDRHGEGRTLNSIGAVYDSLGEKQKALEFLNQALTIQAAINDRAGEAATLNSLGSIYYSLGNRGRALELFDQALVLHRAVNNLDGEGITLNSIGMVYYFLGELQKAQDFYDKALLIYRSTENRAGEAAALSNIGVVYDSLGENLEALLFYNPALSIYRTVGDRRGEAITLNNMGHLYHNLGHNLKALELYNRALRIFRTIGDRTNEAVTLNNMGTVYLTGIPRILGPFERDSRIEDKLTVYTQGKAETNDLSEVRRVNIDVFYIDKKKALKLYGQALRLHRLLGERGGEARTLGNIGFVYASLGERRKALQSYSEALPLFDEIRDRIGEAAISHNLMAFWTRDNAALAVFFGKQAVNTLQHLRANISGFEKGLQRTFIRSKESIYRELASLLISQGRLPEAQQVLGLLKEDEYFEFVRRDGEAASLTAARISFTSAEAEMEKRFSEITDRIAEIGARRNALLAIKERTSEQETQLSEAEANLQIANQAFQKFLDQLQVEMKKTPGGGNDVSVVREWQPLKDTLRELDAVALYTIVGRSITSSS